MQLLESGTETRIQLQFIAFDAVMFNLMLMLMLMYFSMSVIIYTYSLDTFELKMET